MQRGGERPLSGDVGSFGWARATVLNALDSSSEKALQRGFGLVRKHRGSRRILGNQRLAKFALQFTSHRETDSESIYRAERNHSGRWIRRPFDRPGRKRISIAQALILETRAERLVDQLRQGHGQRSDLI